MIPDFCIKNGWFTKHPLKKWLFRVPGVSYSRLFWGWIFPYISCIHTIHITLLKNLSKIIHIISANDPFSLPSLKLTACPWKMMVGRQSLSFWESLFSGALAVSFREGTGTWLRMYLPFFSPRRSQTASTSHAAAAPVPAQAPDGHEVGSTLTKKTVIES